jgi:outer membrane protein OmpA-like peptidoglycan-associated protein/tetratricopeptide (TPR) repeat protein
MHSIRRILIFSTICFAFSIQTLLAQEQDKEQSKAYMEQAQLMLDAGSIALEEIRDVMIQAAEYDTTSIKANFEAGHLFLQTINQEQAVKFFMRVYRQQPNYKYDLEYWIGQSYQYGSDFDKAIEYYTKYKSKASRAQGSQKNAAENDRRIVECQNGKELMAAPQNFSIINLGREINSEYEDYAPVLNEDETQLVFTTRRRDGNVNQDVDSDNKPFEDIFIATKSGDKWSASKNVGSPVTTLTHESSAALTRDGNTLLIYKDDNNGDIYVTSRKPDGTWTAPDPLEGINSNFAETSASFSPDGNTLYFASDRPGGLGGFDIFVASKDSRGNWTRIKNLGAGINTEYDEEGPFLDHEGKILYFSSKGRKTMGGYDIFKSALVNAKDNKWSEPENLGYPINTPDNDIYFVGSKDGKHGYYSSTREDGRGYSDIYRVDVPEAAKKEKLPAKLDVRVFDATTKKEADAKVTLVAVNDKSPVSMTSTRAGVYDFTITTEETKDYTLLVEKEGYVSQTAVINITGAAEKANLLTRYIELKKPDDPSANKPVDKTPTTTPTEPATTTNKSTSPVKFTVKVLDAATKQALDAKVSLTSVKDKKAIALASSRAGAYDFSITADGAKDYRLSVEKDGYVFQNTVISIAGASAKANTITRTIELRKPAAGVTQILHNIYFDIDKATFKKESYDELGKLETMMKQNSALKIEIAGHTDSFGSDAYNKKLSLARASAVRKFLTSKGIDVKRVTAAGYGDTRPLASNDDEDDGREINRRVEFKIISN